MTDKAKANSDGAEAALEMMRKMGNFQNIRVDGIRFPPSMPGMKPINEKIEDLRQMTLRDDDVFLLTYMKAGTHWLWEVISMLRKGRAEHDKNTKEQLMMEVVDIEILNSMPSPRTFNTHLPLSMLPVPEIRARRLKLVHVYRNPKDVCVSLYHMVRSSMVMKATLSGAADSFASFFEHFFFSDDVLFGSYFKYMRQIHEFQQQNPDVPFINIAYEDMKKDPVVSVKQLSSFLGVAVSDDLCVQIAEECSFDKMKKMEAEKATVEISADEKNKGMMDILKTQMPVIYRKGQVGDWKNYFTVAMNERADQVIEKEMKDLPFTLTFE